MSNYTIDKLTKHFEKSIDELLPSQSSNSGKFLTTDGVNSAWVEIDKFPDQTGNDGKYLTTNGSTVSWATVDALPSQTGNSGKYLTTNGTTASWTTISSYTLPTASDTTLGGIKVGSNLSIDANGVLSATDTVTTAVTSGSGNAVTAITASNGALTVTKGTTFAPLASPALTGTPTAPTATAGDNSTQIATTAYVDGAVSALVDSAPAALDTLNELSAALGDDPNFATTVATSLGNKIDSNSANYVKSLSISGKTITVTKGNNTTSTLTTQDTVYTHPTTSGNKHIPAGGSSGQILKWSADGTATWGNETDTVTTVTVTGEGNAITNIIDSNGALTATKGETFSLASHTHSDATTSVSGFMSSTDKDKLDGIDTNANNYSLPTASSSTLGGIKVGTNLSINSSTGVLSATDTITTVTVTGSGNAITDITDSNGALTATKGSTFSLSNHNHDSDYAPIDHNHDSDYTPITSGVGSATNPVYTNSNGVITACTYSLNKTVPSDAVFTDTVYTHPTTSGNKHIPSGGSSGQVLVWASDGTAAWSNASDSALPAQTGNSGKYLTTNGTSASWGTIPTYTDFVGSGATAASGLVPAPSTTAGTTKYLREDGSWEVPPNDNTVSTITTSGSGNAITSITASNGAFTATKGSTFSLSTHNHDSEYTAKATSKGSATKGIYTDSNGAIQEMTYSVNKDVPSDAVFTDTTYGVVSTTANGLAPKSPGGTTKYLRADGTWVVPPNDDTVYTHPTTSGNKHIPSGGSSGQILVWSADGTATWGSDTDTVTTVTVTGTGNAITNITDSNGALTATKGSTFSLSTHNHDSDYTPITSGVGSATQPVYTNSNGVITACTYSLNKTVPSDAVFTDTTYSVVSTTANGLVPKSPGGTTKYLRADGTWVVPPNDNTVTTVTVTGEGNAITDITDSNGALTATKGSTFSLSSHNHDSSYTAKANSVGSGVNPIYTDSSGALTASTSTVGSTDTPVYLNSGTITTTGKSFSSYLPLAGGTMTGSIKYGQGSNWGNYMDEDQSAISMTNDNGLTVLVSGNTKTQRFALTTYPGTAEGSSYQDWIRLYSMPKTKYSSGSYGAGDHTTALGWNAATGELYSTYFSGKLGTSTIGGTAKPIYNNAGTLTAISDTVGSTDTPVYLNGGTITTTGKSFANYATLASPALTGTPTAPTATAGTNSTQIATTAYVDGAITSLINGAPATLDTLKELADVLTDDTSGIGAINTALESKLNSGIVTTGSGNAITAISDSNGTVTATKGSTFSLSTHDHDSTYLKLIGGTLTGNVDINKSNPSLAFKNSNATSGTNPSNTLEIIHIGGHDKDGKYTSFIGSYVTSDGTSNLVMRVHKYDGSSNAPANKQLRISIDSQGNWETEAPTPATSDNSTQIATTAFVKAQGYITSSGSITGNAATATKLGTTDVGSATQPIYLDDGTPKATTYTLGKSVPSDAVFTDTTYTQGSGITISGTTISANSQFPTQTGNSGKFLTTNGSAVSWATPPTTSVNITTGSTNGTIAVDNTDVSVYGLGSAAYTDSTDYTAKAVSKGSATKGIYTDSNGAIQEMTYSLNKTVPSDAVFTDTVTTATTSGSGNAVTAITASNGALSVTKGSTFSLSTHDHDSTYLKLSGGTLTGVLRLDTGNVNLSNTSTSTREYWNIIANKNPEDTVHSGNYYQFGVAQSANSKNMTAIWRLCNPRGGNLPTDSTGGVSTGNNWSGLGIFYNYDLNRGYPLVTGGALLDIDASDNSGYLATTGFVKKVVPVSIGSATKPVYTDSNGVVTACTYELNKTVPSNAVFTDTDTKVNVTLGTTTKAYLLGTSTTPTSTATGVTAIADTGVYLDTTAGKLTATTFAGALSGNASSATEFSANKSVTLTGAVTGTASSKAGWSIATTRRSCNVGQSGSSSTNPWYKVATVDLSSTANYDASIDFLVEDTYSSHKYGILKVHIRTDGSKIVTTGGTELTWLTHTGFTLADFVLVCPTTAGPTCELWTKIATGYMYRKFTVLSEGNRSGFSNSLWTLLDASSAGQANSITTSGTQIVSTNACMANTATKLGTSTVGGTTTPIYLDSGTPTALSYTIAKSVPSDAKFTDTVYTHPTTSGNKHIPSGGSSGQFLKWSADGTATWAADNNTVTTATTTGTGNAVTAITASNGALTVTKGSTFSVSTHNHDSTYLKLSGGTITGSVHLKNSSITRGTAPSAAAYMTYGFKDSAGNYIGVFESSYATDKSSKVGLYAYKTTAATGNNIGNIGVGCNASGNVYTWAPTPATSDNSTQIATTAYVKAQGYITSSGTAANVSGTVAIANGGTGATTRLNALKALTNENVGTNSTYFLTITDSWGKGGYCSVANAKTVLGLGSAAYTASTAYATSGHNHDSAYLARLSNIIETGRYIDMHYDNATATYDYDVRIYVSAQGTAKGGGTLTITAAAVNTTKVTGAYYADYAEWFARGEETEPGDVIVLDLDSDKEKYIKSTKDNKIVVGVHSDNWHHIIGGEEMPKDCNVDYTEYHLPKYIPVALAGRIKTKFIGKAKKGSYVVASEVTGVARAYDRTIDNPEDIFGILVETDNKDQEIRRLNVKLK